jgi:hypothetical protein
MQETHIVAGLASVFSLLAIVGTLVTVPQLYLEMNDIELRVRDGIQAFRGKMKAKK